MTYHFIHYFEPGRCYIPKEDRLKIARERAIEDLAKELMQYAHFELDNFGNVNGTLHIPDGGERRAL
jgi:hypothetical protein